MKHYFAADVELDGSITIPAKKFSDILHSLPDGKEVDLVVDSRAARSSLSVGVAASGSLGPRSRNILFFPSSINRTLLRRRRTLCGRWWTRRSTPPPAMRRHVLNGVFWSAKKGMLDMVATDGRRLAVISKKAIPADKDFQVIVPTKVLAELLRILNAADDEKRFGRKLMVGVTENQISFQFKTTTLISRLVGGAFPQLRPGHSQEERYFHNPDDQGSIGRDQAGVVVRDRPRRLG